MALNIFLEFQLNHSILCDENAKLKSRKSAYYIQMTLQLTTQSYVMKIPKSRAGKVHFVYN